MHIVVLGTGVTAVHQITAIITDTRARLTFVLEVITVTKERTGQPLTFHNYWSPQLIALLTAVLNRLNVGDDVDHVLLQDVALARQVAGALSWARDAVVAKNHMVLIGLREEGACSGKDMSLRGHPG